MYEEEKNILSKQLDTFCGKIRSNQRKITLQNYKEIKTNFNRNIQVKKCIYVWCKLNEKNNNFFTTASAH